MLQKTCMMWTIGLVLAYSFGLFRFCMLLFRFFRFWCSIFSAVAVIFFWCSVFFFSVGACCGRCSGFACLLTFVFSALNKKIVSESFFSYYLFSSF